MPQTRIDIKGTSHGLIIRIGPGDWSGLTNELASRLEQTPSFFKGGRVALAVGQREVSVEKMGHIQALLAQHEVTLGTVISEMPATRAAAGRLGLETKRSFWPKPRPKRRDEEDFSEGALVRCTLHSGQIIRHPGHVVVIGDVNAGAEVVAGGDIVIWGRLRGTVHAGATGDDQTIVCALDLAPTQLRIGKHVARSPEGRRRRKTIPEVASLEAGMIIVRAWKSGR